MTLLDNDTQSYFMKWEGNTFNVIDYVAQIETTIENKSGKVIGKINSGGTFKKWILLNDDTDSLVIAVSKRRLGLAKTYDILDAENKKLGEAKSKSITWNKGMGMKNNDKKGILDITGPKHPPGIWEINDVNGKNIAKLGIKIENIKQGFLKSKTINKCALHVTESSFNRKLLLGFFLSILSSFFDKTHSSGG